MLSLLLSFLKKLTFVSLVFLSGYSIFLLYPERRGIHSLISSRIFLAAIRGLGCSVTGRPTTMKSAPFSIASRGVTTLFRSSCLPANVFPPEDGSASFVAEVAGGAPAREG